MRLPFVAFLALLASCDSYLSSRQADAPYETLDDAAGSSSSPDDRFDSVDSTQPDATDAKAMEGAPFDALGDHAYDSGGDDSTTCACPTVHHDCLFDKDCPKVLDIDWWVPGACYGGSCGARTLGNPCVLDAHCAGGVGPGANSFCDQECTTRPAPCYTDANCGPLELCLVGYCVEQSP